MCHCTEPVDDGEYDGVPLGAGQGSDEVQKDVEPRAAGNWQRLEKAHQGLARELVLAAQAWT